MRNNINLNKVKILYEKILKYKIYIICIAITLLSILSILMQENELTQIKINGIGIYNDQDQSKICVYITGEVKNPGVYYLESSTRLDKLIDFAGGITESADIDKLNLSKKLLDGEKIVVPKKTSTENAESDLDTQLNQSNVTVENNLMVNINTASKEELMKLKSVGESTANKIIEYRKKSKFEKIEDILNVDGIGEVKFNNIKDNICI